MKAGLRRGGRLAARTAGLALLVALALPAGVCAAGTGSAQAAPAALASQEIEQLIAALGRSGCSFQRNGSWHDAGAAQEHLQRKYEWMRDRGRIASAEQFIEDGASRSSMSGRAYQVRCPGQPVQTAAAWLRARLRDLRGAR
jgi:hypothetical protein